MSDPLVEQAVRHAIAVSRRAKQPVATVVPVAPQVAIDPRYPCPYRGVAVGESRCLDGCDPNKRVPLWACSQHGQCSTVLRTESGARRCVTCATRPAIAEKVARSMRRVEWISTERLVRDSLRLGSLLPADCAGVIGVPRSGMIAASAIATHYHLPLYHLPAGSGPPQPTGHGGRGTAGFPDAKGPYALVEDTVFGGGSMGRSLARCRRHGWRVLTCAVYCTPWRTQTIDRHAVALDAPHVLAWHWANGGPAFGHWAAGAAGNHLWGGGVAVDFDGVLCEEPTVPDADGGPGLERYRQWLTEAKPLVLPRRHPLRLIVTGRLEQFRPETEAWLTRWGIGWDRLVMCPHPTASARARAGDVPTMKGREFGESKCGIFLESDPRQCPTIHAIGKKPVVCPPTGEVWQ
jgi:hypothetical protein